MDGTDFPSGLIYAHFVTSNLRYVPWQPYRLCLTKASRMKTNRNIVNALAMIPYSVTIDRCIEHDHSTEFIISWQEPSGDDRICPACGSNRCVKKDAGSTQTVRHLPVGFSGTLITFHKPRFRCKDCGKTFFVKPSWIAPDISVTVFLFVAIQEKLCQTPLSIAQIARDTHTSPSIVKNIIRHISLEPPRSLPESLGIDEFKGATGYYNRNSHRYDTEKYHCVIVDTDQGAVIDILYKATYNELFNYFMSFSANSRRNVKFFCMDMRSGFSKVARKCFPHARICIDMFHVVKLLTVIRHSKIPTDDKSTTNCFPLSSVYILLFPVAYATFFIAISTFECYGMLVAHKQEEGPHRPKFVPLPPAQKNIANLP